MNIVQITPGTGNFHCGSCLRDNALVLALRAMGHDVVMVPLYLPHVVDEAEAAGDVPVFYGGVNVYLQQKSSLFRHTPRWLDRLFDARRLLRFAADHSNMTKARDIGEIAVSMLQGEHGRQVKELERLTSWLVEHHRPQVVSLSNIMLIGMARRIREALGVPIVCTLQGEDSYLDALVEPYRSECWRLIRERASDVAGFIAVSRYYGRVMRQRVGLEERKVHVVPNGITMDGYMPADKPPDPPVIGYLARMCPAKGLHTLIDAYIRLRTGGRVPGVRLHAAGSMNDADAAYVAEQRKRIVAAGLGDSAEFHPNVSHEQKLRFLRGLSVLSVPATYGESFGLYVLEAWASGVPVVQPRHGAFEELLEDGGGGMLCEPDDAESLAGALDAMLRNPAQSRAMGLRGRAAVLERFTVQRMAEGVLRVCEQAGA